MALLVVIEKVQQAPQLFHPLWRHKFQIGTALAVATVLGAAGFFAGPYVGAVSSGMCGFVVTLAAQTGFRLRRFLTTDRTTV